MTDDKKPVLVIEIGTSELLAFCADEVRALIAKMAASKAALDIKEASQ